MLIDDILDTGNTLTKITEIIANMNPASLRTCVLLDKQTLRQVNFNAHYVGFEIPDEFVVGYGLDFAERYRQLPASACSSPSCKPTTVGLSAFSNSNVDLRSLKFEV